MSTRGIRKTQSSSRNRGPCKPCQVAKRKCDQLNPTCSRCQKTNQDCEPSVQARWRVKTIQDSYQSFKASHPTTITNSASSADPATRESSTVSESPINSPTPAAASASVNSAPPLASSSSSSWPESQTLSQINDGPDLMNQGDSLHKRTRDGPDYQTRSSDSDVAGRNETRNAVVSSPAPDQESMGHTYSTTDANLPSILFSPSQFDLSYYGAFLNQFDNTRSTYDPGTPSFQASVTSGAHHAEMVFQDFENMPSLLSPAQASSVVSEALQATINQILASDEVMVEQDAQRRYIISLWDLFVVQIAPSLTPFGNRLDNPFLKYLVPKCEKSAALLTAVLYLAQIISRRSEKDDFAVDASSLETKAEAILQALEHDDVLTPRTLGEPEDRTSQMLLTLTIVLVFCMAFIANKDGSKLSLYVEYAVVICQTLFKTLAEDEGFLYLAKLLGFMQNSILFSTRANIVNAPDYLGAALEFHDRNSDALREIDGGHSHDHVHFRDLDMFSGMSASIASIVYTLGTLVKRKKRGVQDSNLSQGEWVKAFESEVDGLEVRLRRHLTLLKKRSKLQSSSNIPQHLHDLPLTRYLNSYNEAVFWSAWAIFLTDIQDRCPNTDTELTETVEHILDACAEVPEENVTASLLLFPLAIGGMRSTKKVYQEFVMNRLKHLTNVGLTDTQLLCTELKNWWSTDRHADSPIAFTSTFIF
ncbi:hypothetical protein BT63DRAFT_410107 [Microthyrium microscopicum]|uniref:Zn(2)-C6 fungal-type domain-containing protein n=1 Tax=Microthyrium microscopicum TaxID=703497 RepID=A0A6A6UQ66_9PEZI|nr:hypothetical protein BT63DRAFT_410107 [Microthyrium microscopicum]